MTQPAKPFFETSPGALPDAYACVANAGPDDPVPFTYPSNPQGRTARLYVRGWLDHPPPVWTAPYKVPVTAPAFGTEFVVELTETMKVIELLESIRAQIAADTRRFVTDISADRRRVLVCLPSYLLALDNERYYPEPKI